MHFFVKANLGLGISVNFVENDYLALTDNGPIFDKSHGNLRIFLQYTLILRKTYDSV